MFFPIGDDNIEGANTGGVAWWAHIGGFVFGLVSGYYYRVRFRTDRHIRPD